MEIGFWFTLFSLFLFPLCLFLLSKTFKPGSRKSNRKNVVVLGSPQCGKTTLFLRLTKPSDKNVRYRTLASIDKNEFVMEDGIRLVDIPGHRRFREKWTEHILDSNGVIFIIDSKALKMSTDIRNLARDMIDVFVASIQKALPILICYNKRCVQGEMSTEILIHAATKEICNILADEREKISGIDPGKIKMLAIEASSKLPEDIKNIQTPCWIATSVANGDLERIKLWLQKLKTGEYF